jgi:hypothetical protein
MPGTPGAAYNQQQTMWGPAAHFYYGSSGGGVHQM